MPPTQAFSLADQMWIDKIYEETDGQVVITPYWGGALIGMTECITELSKGVADIAYIAADYMKEGFHIENSMRILFYGVSDLETEHRIYNELRSKFPEIDAEYSAVKIMAAHDTDPYQLITRVPVRTLEDLEGLTIKAAGLHAQVLTSLGAEGVSMPMSEVYINLQKGIIDGAIAPYQCLEGFNFAEVAKYATRLDLATGPTPHRAMNWDSYNSLPEDIQKIFDDSIDFWVAKNDEISLEAMDSGIAFGVAQGVEFIEFSPEELSEFYSAVEAVVLEEMAKLDDMGLPGTAIHEEIRRLVEEYS
jgi:TRAP-type C4-dicarboxylate transport system substrate-binding protein